MMTAQITSFDAHEVQSFDFEPKTAITFELLPAAHAQSIAPISISQSIPTVTIQQGEVRSITANMIDDDGDPITFVAIEGNATKFASISATGYGTPTATATVTLAPTRATESGAYIITIVAVSGDGLQGDLYSSRSVQIVVIEDPTPSVNIADIQNIRMSEGDRLPVSVSVTPSGAILALQGSGLGISELRGNEILLAPKIGEAGTYTIRVFAVSGGAQDTESFTVIVDPIGDTTIDQITPVTMRHTATEELEISVNTEDDNPYILITSGGDIASLDLDTMILTLDPDENDIGTHQVTITVISENSDAKMSFGIVVTDDPPTIRDLPDLNMSHMQTLKIQVNPHDADGDETVLSLSGNATAFTTANQEDGTILLDPLRAHIDEDYSLTVTVTANGKTDETTFSISIFADLEPEIGSIQDVSMSYIETRTVAINVTDPDGDDVTLAVAGKPIDFIKIRGLNLDLTPSEFDVGEYAITLVATAAGKSSFAEFNITIIDQDMVIRQVNDIIIPHNMNHTEEIVVITKPGLRDSFIFDPIISNIATFNETTRILSITPTNNDVGEHYIDISVYTDGDFSSEDVENIFVNVTDSPPSIDPIDDRTIFFREAETINIMVDDAEGDDVTVTVTSPDFADYNPRTEQLTIYPRYSDIQKEPYMFIITAESNGIQNEETFEVTVLDDKPVIREIIVNNKRVISADELDTTQIEIGDKQVKNLYINVTDPRGGEILLSNILGNGTDMTEIDYDTHVITLDPDEKDAGEDGTTNYTIQVSAIADNTRISDPVTIRIQVTNASMLIDEINDVRLIQNGTTASVFIDAYSRSGGVRYNVTLESNSALVDPDKSLLRWSPTSTKITINPSYKVTELTGSSPYVVNVTAYDRRDSTVRDSIEFKIHIDPKPMDKPAYVLLQGSPFTFNINSNGKVSSYPNSVDVDVINGTRYMAAFEPGTIHQDITLQGFTLSKGKSAGSDNIDFTTDGNRIYFTPGGTNYLVTNGDKTQQLLVNVTASSLSKGNTIVFSHVITLQLNVTTPAQGTSADFASALRYMTGEIT